MDTDLSPRSWTDDQLAHAVNASTSWRGVLRALGLKATSAYEIRIVRRHAERLKLDASHFRGKRRWSDDQLRQAVAECKSWDEVVLRLGLSTGSGSVQPHIKSHAIRLGLGPAIAGRTAILLRTYRKYIVGNARGLLGVAAETGGTGRPASA